MGDPEQLPTIAGYTIKRMLAEGGMGTVYEGVHNTLQRRVAVKLLKQQFAQDQDFAERFLREARAAATLDHPGVVRVHDAGRSADGHLFLAMAFIDGNDLSAWCREPSPLIEADILRIGQRCAEALAAIHAAGLIHRDIKPDNILMTPAGEPIITDLGLARSEQGDDRMTNTGQVLGTPAYMSPEQAKGETTLDCRSDIYSLGATLFALLAGKPPFEGATPWATVAAIMSEAPPQLASLRPGLHPDTCALIMACLAKNPAERPSSASALAEQLAALQTGATQPRASTQATMIAAEPSQAATRDPTRAWLLPIGIGGGMLALVAAIVLLGNLARGGDQAPSESIIALDSQPAGDSQGDHQAVAQAEPSETAGQRRERHGGKSMAASSSPTDPASTPTEATTTTPPSSTGSVKSGVFDLESGLRGALEVRILGDVTSNEARIRAELEREGLSIAHHDLDDGIAEIEGDYQGKEYRVRILPVDDAHSRLTVQRGFIGDKEAQQAIFAAIEDVLTPAE
ncbi:MAG: serine/threonine-protein kinase [Planctomycetota bacterium]|jgi:serine/threonine protein kinase|nr:serine/threonine-protein kinase [Planctomycetota bacterium]